MPNIERPDLTTAAPEVRAYIEALEAELASQSDTSRATTAVAAHFGPVEPPTTLNVVTASLRGWAKRSPRHLYERQRRGGMGVFDIELAADDQPAWLIVADESHSLLLLTNMARAFHIGVRELAQAPIRGRGQLIADALQLRPGERLAWLLPAARGVNIALLSEQGYVRVLPAHVVGQNINPGTTLFRHADFGPLVAACWSPGGGDLFVATRRGQAIRFPERALAVSGGQAIRLDTGDSAVAIEAVRPPDGEAIFMLGADGRGTVRHMSGFAANKSPGGGGKVAFKTDYLVGAMAVAPGDDVFAISRLSKIIRFSSSEVPAKDGPVQGVVCMALRGDECAAMTVTPQPRTEEAA
jgi:DNA gyrase/topoisomerase IV subunit A